MDKTCVDVRQVASAVFQSDLIDTNIDFDVIHHVVDITMRKLWLAGIAKEIEVNISDGLKLKVEVIQ